MNFNCEVVLASNSPRRKELLKLIFDDFKVVNANIDESDIEKKILKENFNSNKDRFEKVCLEIAKAKCSAVSKLYTNSLVISADTIVYDEEKIFGKPYNREKAIYMLNYLSGKTHIVQTSVCIYYDDKYYTFSEKSFVTFNDLNDVQRENIITYVDTYKPFDKSGSYGIQDRGNKLIKDFEGDLFNIVGLPISRLFKELHLITNNIY